MSVLVVSDISDLPSALSREVEVEVGEHDHREQQDVGKGSRLAGSEILERDAVDINCDRLSRRAGTAFGQQENDVEQLERLDGAKQQRQHQEATDVGEGDRPAR